MRAQGCDVKVKSLADVFEKLGSCLGNRLKPSLINSIYIFILVFREHSERRYSVIILGLYQNRLDSAPLKKREGLSSCQG